MPALKQVNIRDFQHNLAMYMDVVKVTPLSITRNGVEEAIVLNPKAYKYEKQTKKAKEVTDDLMQSKFIGMHKNRKDWKGKSSVDIARNLRDAAWNGK